MKLFLVAVSTGLVFGQTTPAPTSLSVTRIYSVGDFSNPKNIIDNRSSQRTCNYHSYLASGSGTWSATMQYRDGTSVGSWSSFGSTAAVNQASNPAIGYGNGYHDFVSFAITGAATVRYSCSKDYFISSAASGLSFPINVSQGGTGATTLTGVVIGNGTSSMTAVPAGAANQSLMVDPSGNGFTFGYATDPVGIFASQYVFAAQFPVGNLIAGNTQITIAPVPAGVNGTDVSHQLYVSGGTGTAEACMINGGTAVSGSVNGTLILNCANSHSGAWSLQSATNGAAEAAQILKTAGTGGTIQLQTGAKSQCGTVTITGDGIVIVGAGKSATILTPCFANQALFSVPNGHVYPNVTSKLSMHDIGFNNGGLAGITAISLIGETASTYHDLTFTGSANSMLAINCDRCYNLFVQNVTATGSVGSYFGSSVDGVVVYSYSNTIRIDGYSYTGTAALIPAMTLERCVGCTVRNFDATDAFLTVTGTGLIVANDSQGILLDHVGVEGMFYGIKAVKNTVGATTTMPSFLTLSNVQVDCAGGGNCASLGFVQLQITASNVSIINPILSGPTTSGFGLQIGPNTQNIRVIGGLFNLTEGFNTEFFAPITGLILQGNTILAGSGSYGLWFPVAAPITGAIISGNHIIGLPFTNASTFVNSYFDNNICTIDVSGYCSGILTGGRAIRDFNYVLTETGANNAITGALLDNGGNNVPLTQGLRICVALAHSLQAGANTFALNGAAAKVIKSHFNPANNIGVAYASGAQWCGMYDGTQWEDLSQ